MKRKLRFNKKIQLMKITHLFECFTSNRSGFRCGTTLISESSWSYSRNILTIIPFWSKVLFVKSQIFGTRIVFITSFRGMSGQSFFSIQSPKVLINPIQIPNCRRCRDTGREIEARTLSESYFAKSAFVRIFSAISSYSSSWNTPRQAVHMSSFSVRTILVQFF